jgi:hypothetical protein
VKAAVKFVPLLKLKGRAGKVSVGTEAMGIKDTGEGVTLILASQVKAFFFKGFKLALSSVAGQVVVERMLADFTILQTIAFDSPSPIEIIFPVWVVGLKSGDFSQGAFAAIAESFVMSVNPMFRLRFVLACERGNQ